MTKWPKTIRWSAPFRLYEIYVSMGPDRFDNRDVLFGAALRGTARTLAFIGVLVLSFPFLTQQNTGGLFLVGFGASLLAYTAVRVNLNRVHRRLVADLNEDVVPARRKLYDYSLSIIDSFTGAFIIIAGFGIRLL